MMFVPHRKQASTACYGGRFIFLQSLRKHTFELLRSVTDVVLLYLFYYQRIYLMCVKNTHWHQHFGCSSEEVNSPFIPPDLNYSSEKVTKQTKFRFNLVRLYLSFVGLAENEIEPLVFWKYKVMLQILKHMMTRQEESEAKAEARQQKAEARQERWKYKLCDIY
jgi:hypothetical protein